MKLRPSRSRRYSSSTSSWGIYPKCLLVGWSQKVRENGSNDFSETLHALRYRLVGKFVLSGFSEKNAESAKIEKMWSKWRFLAIFSSLKFFKFFYVVNIDNSDCFRASAKNRISKTIFSEEIFIHKGQILAENGKSGVQRSLYISRTVNGMKNLIRYSESTENFLSCTSHQIFAYSSSSGWKSGSKIGNFSKFSKILQNFAFFEKKIFLVKVSKWSNSQS